MYIQVEDDDVDDVTESLVTTGGPYIYPAGLYLKESPDHPWVSPSVHVLTCCACAT